MGIQTVELVLDEESDQAVRAEWRALEANGLRAASPGARPHITVTARQHIDQQREPAMTERLAALPLSVRLGAPIVFGSGDRVILVRSVTPTAALLRLHLAIHEAVGADARDVSPTCRPDTWTPHITLARLSIDHIQPALKMIMKSHDLEIKLTGARRWDGTNRLEWALDQGLEP